MGVWDFTGESTNEYTHDLHLYPAIMNPQIARRLIKLYGKNAQNLLDPYCGSGTSLVEARLAGLNADGFDLNPIARLISTMKTKYYVANELRRFIDNLIDGMDSLKLLNWESSVEQSGFTVEQIRTWFPDKTVCEIATFLSLLPKPNGSKNEYRLFAIIALSDCLRKVSIQRMREWKMYREEGWRDREINDFYQPLFPTLKAKMLKNLESLIEYSEELTNLSYLDSTRVRIDSTNSVIVENFPSTPEGGYDLVVTSPPYGDSPTTVAYEQFSWLSNVWLGLDNRTPGNLGCEMMGGEKVMEIRKLGHKEIDDSISKMKPDITIKNYSFYKDYLASIRHVANNVQDGGTVCYVVGNRTSGNQYMRLDLFTRWAFEQVGFKRVGRIKKRKLINTRMPNSIAINGNGKKKILPTMSEEFIVVCKKTMS